MGAASWVCRGTQQSRMWTPRRGRQQLDLLCHHKRPELRGKAFHEVLVGEDLCPVLPTVGVVIKLPEMDDLVDRASVGLEVAQELLVMATLLERREAELLVELPPSCRRRVCRFAIRTAPSGILLHRSLICPRIAKGRAADRCLGYSAALTISTDIIEIYGYSTNNVLALLSDWPFSHWARSVCDKANQARGLYRDLSRPAHYY